MRTNDPKFQADVIMLASKALRVPEPDWGCGVCCQRCRRRCHGHMRGATSPVMATTEPAGDGSG